MLNIYYEGEYIDENQLKKRGKEPLDWIQFEEGENLNEAFSGGLLFVLPVMVIIIIMSLEKLKTIDTTYKLDVWTIITILTWIVAVYFMKMLHEYIHALFYPRTSIKYIYTNMKKGFFLIYCNAEISKKRFVIINIAPILFQGIGLFVIWYFLMGIININISLAMLFMSWYMIIFSATDIYNIYVSIFRIPSHVKIANYGLHSYWKKDNEQETDHII